MTSQTKRHWFCGESIRYWRCCSVTLWIDVIRCRYLIMPPQTTINNDKANHRFLDANSDLVIATNALCYFRSETAFKLPHQAASKYYQCTFTISSFFQFFFQLDYFNFFDSDISYDSLLNKDLIFELIGNTTNECYMALHFRNCTLSSTTYRPFFGNFDALLSIHLLAFDSELLFH